MYSNAIHISTSLLAIKLQKHLIIHWDYSFIFISNIFFNVSVEKIRPNSTHMGLQCTAIANSIALW